MLLEYIGYLSATQQLDLFESANIILETPMRKNQEKELKLYFLNCATNLSLQEIMRNLLKFLKQEFWLI